MYHIADTLSCCRAAKKRAAQQAIMSQGPQRLGGFGGRHLCPREAAVRAAERRRRDDRECPSAAIAAGEKIVIDLVDDGSDDEGDARGIHPATMAILNGRMPLGSRAGTSNQALIPPASSIANKNTAGAIAQVGKFAGKLVPGFSDPKNGKPAARGPAETARQSETATMRMRGVSCEPRRSEACSSAPPCVMGVQSVEGATGHERVNQSKVVEIVDLIDSPLQALSGRQSTASLQVCDLQEEAVDAIDCHVDTARVSAPGKRARDAGQLQKEPSDKNFDRGGKAKATMCIDLT
jgi:hypothetical protein